MPQDFVQHRWSRRTALISGLMLAAAFPVAGWTQGAPAPDSEGMLKLTPAQRDLIYSSVANQKHVSTAAPSTWAAQVGGTVPQGVDLTPMPATIVEVVPQMRGYSYAFIAAQVLIVQADSRKVIEIITQKA